MFLESQKRSNIDSEIIDVQISCNASGNGYSGTSTATNIAAGSGGAAVSRVSLNPPGSTNNYRNSSSSSTSASNSNNASAATTGFASVLQPLDFNAPLLVVFKKVRYPIPLYTGACLQLLNNNNCHKQNANLCTSRIFGTMKSFHQWEAAVEIHAACLYQV